MQQRAKFCAVCTGSPNHSCLTLHDVMNYNDVTFAFSSDEFRRTMCFIGV